MDFYIKTLGDPNWNDTQVQTNGEIEQLIQQIETVLFTGKADVLGSPGFGCDLESYIYALGYNEGQLKDVLDTQIKYYCPLAQKYSVSTKVNFLKGNVRDIAYIDITVDSKYLVQLNIR